MNDCPVCRGLRWVRTDAPIGDPRFGKLEPCPRCSGAAQTERLRRISRLGGDLATARLEQWRPMPGVEGVMPDLIQYLIKRGKGDDRKATGWVTLSGPYGTGKTHLLAALVNHYVEAGVPAVYTTMGELLQQLRDTFDPESKTSYSALWRDLTDARVVAIDEVEKFHGTQWAQEQVFLYLNARYNAIGDGLTILATNVDCRPATFVVMPDNGWGEGYIESRMRDGRGIILSQFWKAHDVRPLMEEMESERKAPQAKQVELF